MHRSYICQVGTTNRCDFSREIFFYSRSIHKVALPYLSNITTQTTKLFENERLVID